MNSSFRVHEVDVGSLVHNMEEGSDPCGVEASHRRVHNRKVELLGDVDGVRGDTSYNLGARAAYASHGPRHAYMEHSLGKVDRLGLTCLDDRGSFSYCSASTSFACGCFSVVLDSVRQ